MVQNNLEIIEQKIQAACQRAGRDRSEVTLIAVSKTKPVSMIREAMDCGLQVFGENKVQELCDKYEELPKDLQWHMIGHLQRNKVKYLIGKTALIHSVDSLRLAQAVQEEAAKKGAVMDILLEVNAAEEESKFGLAVEEVLPLVRQIAPFPNLRVKGLMTVAPFVQDPEENRKYFRTLKQLAVDINDKNIDNVHVNILSMGMTNDYEVAIEEGATMVRIGTGIFGERDYQV